MTKSKIQIFIKILNNFFINIILFLFYFFIIGVISIFYKLFKNNKEKRNSYWEDYKAGKSDLEYFKSAY